MRISLDVMKYQLDELDKVNEIAGAPFGVIIRRLTEFRGLDIKALAFVNARRTNPKFTLEMAGRLMLDDIEWDEEGDGENPTEASGTSSGPTG